MAPAWNVRLTTVTGPDRARSCTVTVVPTPDGDGLVIEAGDIDVVLVSLCNDGSLAVIDPETGETLSKGGRVRAVPAA
jgi:hypothetical protein